MTIWTNLAAVRAAPPLPPDGQSPVSHPPPSLAGAARDDPAMSLSEVRIWTLLLMSDTEHLLYFTDICVFFYLNFSSMPIIYLLFLMDLTYLQWCEMTAYRTSRSGGTCTYIYRTLSDYLSETA